MATRIRLRVALDDTIVAAQTGKPGIGVIYPSDKARVLADSFQGKPFNRPNDLIVDRGGGIYFTDPGPGPAQRQPGVAAPAIPPIPAVYYLSPQGELRQLATDIPRPNGISLESRRKDAVCREHLWRTRAGVQRRQGRLCLETA